MILLKEGVREDLQSGPCFKCGGHISKDEGHILSFYRGTFVLLHKECRDFITQAQGGYTER